MNGMSVVLLVRLEGSATLYRVSTFEGGAVPGLEGPGRRRPLLEGTRGVEGVLDGPLPDNELAVKDWSENEGVVEELKRQNVIFGDPMRTFNTAYGFVKIKVFALTDYGESLFRKEDGK